MMYVGYTFLEIAQVSPKNRNFVAKKNMMMVSISFIVFFIIGYAFAFGYSSAGIIGAQTNYVGVFAADHLFHERQFPFYFASSLVTNYYYYY